MSEFKFACPVCGQHITADPRASGTELACPTCFRQIVVPQAPVADSKLILAAAHADKPRPGGGDPGQDLGPLSRRRARARLPGTAALLLLALIGTAVWLWGSGLAQRLGLLPKPPPRPVTPARVVHPIPTHIAWTLNPLAAVIPEQRAVGTLRGEGFLCERASLKAGTLTLRQGKGHTPDLGISIVLYAQRPEELSGKSVIVGPDRKPPLPKITLRWNDAQQLENSEEIASGYALKLIFGQPTDGRMPGRLYLSLPDTNHSFVAGTFEAQIRKPD